MKQYIGIIILSIIALLLRNAVIMYAWNIVLCNIIEDLPYINWWYAWGFSMIAEIYLAPILVYHSLGKEKSEIAIVQVSESFVYLGAFGCLYLLNIAGYFTPLY